MRLQTTVVPSIEILTPFTSFFSCKLCKSPLIDARRHCRKGRGRESAALKDESQHMRRLLGRERGSEISIVASLSTTHLCAFTNVHGPENDTRAGLGFTSNSDKFHLRDEKKKCIPSSHFSTPKEDPVQPGQATVKHLPDT